MVKPSQLTHHVPRSFRSNATPSHVTPTIYPLVLSFLVALRDFREYHNEEGYHILLSHNLYRSLVLLSILIFQGNRTYTQLAKTYGTFSRGLTNTRNLQVMSCLVLGLHQGYERFTREAQEYQWPIDSIIRECARLTLVIPSFLLIGLRMVVQWVLLSTSYRPSFCLAR